MAAIYTNGLEYGGRYYPRMTPAEQEHRRGIRYILESYHYVNKQHRVDAMRKDGVKVFLDSGAFSAHTQGITINLDKYCRYIHDNADIVLMSSVLDVLGNADKTYANQKAMEANGVYPLPCFHYGEDEKHLVRYIDQYEYISLGGVALSTRTQLKLWLDRLFDKYICDRQGKPRVKVHGFAVTSMELMTLYPWYSVDSSSWVQIGSMGNILIPGLGAVAISDTSPRTKEEGQHFDNLTPVQQAGLMHRIAQRGFEWERLRKEYISRWMFNCAVFKEMNLELENKSQTFKLAQQPLF